MKKKFVLNLFIIMLLIGGVYNLKINITDDTNNLAYTYTYTYSSDYSTDALKIIDYFEKSAIDSSETYAKGIYYIDKHNYTVDENIGEVIRNSNYVFYDNTRGSLTPAIRTYGIYYFGKEKKCGVNTYSFIEVKEDKNNQLNYSLCLSTYNNYVYDTYENIKNGNYQVRNSDFNQNDTTMLELDKIMESMQQIALIMSVVMFLMMLLDVIANWCIFKKANKPGWASIVPFYNNYILYQITWGNGWFFLLPMFIIFLPIVGAIVSSIIMIVTSVKLGKVFDKKGGFIVGLVLLNPIFKLILAFDKSKYVGIINNNQNNNQNLNNINSNLNQPLNDNSVSNIPNQMAQNYYPVIENGVLRMEPSKTTLDNINRITENKELTVNQANEMDFSNEVADSVNQQTAPTPKEEVNEYCYCIKCGTKLLNSTPVCPRCGTKVK